MAMIRPPATPISTVSAEDRVLALRKIRSKAVLAFMGPGRLEQRPEPSGTAVAGQLQIVCSFEAQLFKICACSLADRL